MLAILMDTKVPIRGIVCGEPVLWKVEACWFSSFSDHVLIPKYLSKIIN